MEKLRQNFFEKRRVNCVRRGMKNFNIASRFQLFNSQIICDCIFLEGVSISHLLYMQLLLIPFHFVFNILFFSVLCLSLTDRKLFITNYGRKSGRSDMCNLNGWLSFFPSHLKPHLCKWHLTMTLNIMLMSRQTRKINELLSFISLMTLLLPCSMLLNLIPPT